MANILKRAKPPKDNITRTARKAIEELRKDDTIVILKADKGNTTVVMDKVIYEEKINNMLSDTTTYMLLNKDPMKGSEKQMKLLLSSKKQKLGDKLYRRLSTTDGAPPRLYGLPKLHKERVPLKPIVSFVGSATYELSEYLRDILSPSVGNSDYNIKNSHV